MRDLNTAAIAQAKAAWNAMQVFATGAVPDAPPSPYLVLNVGSGSAENFALGGVPGSRSYRLVVQAVGKTVGEVGFAAEKADTAFLDRPLTVAGLDCTPCEPEVASPVIRDPDGGALLSVTVTYTFTTFNKE